MKTLVWVEHDGSTVRDATLSAVTAAAKLGEVHLIVAGQDVGGVATEAASAALEHGRATLALKRIIAVSRSDNAASHGVLEKIGMRRRPAAPSDVPVLVYYVVDMQP